MTGDEGVYATLWLRDDDGTMRSQERCLATAEHTDFDVVHLSARSFMKDRAILSLTGIEAVNLGVQLIREGNAAGTEAIAETNEAFRQFVNELNAGKDNT